MNMNLKTVLVALAAGAMLAACSDDDKTYTDSVYFTGDQQSVVAIGRTGGNASIGSASTVVCFDAASNRR